MAGKLTPAGLIAKWFLAPIALGLAGYFLVGPRIGTSSKHEVDSSQQSANEPNNADPAPATSAPVAIGQKPRITENADGGPDVDVTVHKVTPSNTEVAATAPRHRAHRHHKVPAAPAAHPVTPDPSKASPPDEGGSAGSTTAG